ncbi:hypothetical protein HanXRQr2_Chr16g0774561 [Helianthus annuus]|uniref:Uncharacterized protein n=1 Tax=Helianthus annuus TaxID=4232 RepID=A0A9K3H0Q3_HELAN|nr:hypothetical protein HanXRQr2_Chr16g0774561 [Helianthus annuus]KAJ0642784.1 hypothetical protein HanLR1_Chr16g0642161 [Helianthus annuus]KAJ0646652.1 hypothetical protein HanOQP8_Chr16g0637531 [Helianthus annuus]
MPRFNSTTTAAIPFSLYHSLPDPIHLVHGGGKQNDRRSGDMVTMIMLTEIYPSLYIILSLI